MILLHDHQILERLQLVLHPSGPFLVQNHQSVSTDQLGYLVPLVSHLQPHHGPVLPITALWNPILVPHSDLRADGQQSSCCKAADQKFQESGTPTGDELGTHRTVTGTAEHDTPVLHTPALYSGELRRLDSGTEHLGKWAGGWAESRSSASRRLHCQQRQQPRRKRPVKFSFSLSVGRWLWRVSLQPSWTCD